MALKIYNNLYKYSDNTYLVAINKKNLLGEKIVINQYFEATSDSDAINYRNKVWKENNFETKTNQSKKVKKDKCVSKYIYQISKNSYRIRIKKNKLFPNGFSEYVEGELKEVEEYRDQIIAKSKLGKTPISKYRNFTLKDFEREFIEKYCYDNISDVTAEDYDRMLVSFVNKKFGKYKMYEIENMTSDIQLFINELKTTPNKHKPDKAISTKYQNSIYNAFNKMLNVAVDWGAITKNPMESIKPPKFKTKKTKFYTLDEMYDILDKLFENESIREKFMITIFVCAGIRKGELVGLHTDSFNFENNTIKVKYSVVSTKRKGTTYEKETKTENGERIIKLPKFVMNLAKVYFKYREEQISMFVNRYGKDYNAPDNVFLSRFGKIMHPDTPYKVWTNFRNKYALGDVTPHGLRHSWCTANYHENEYLTPKELAVLMGHGTDIKMTEHYTHEIESRMQRADAIWDNYQKKIDNKKNNKFVINFVELSTVLSGRLYTDSDKITDLLKKYYNMETDPTFEEIPYKLLNLRQAVIKENDLYNEIKDFLKENSNDWKAINKGIEKYGNEFAINGYTKSKQYDEKDTKIDKEMVI